MALRYSLGVDIGGTFTDFVLVDEETGGMVFAKQLTTPHDPSLSVLDGVHRLLADHRVPISEVRALVHGTTLATNALIERKGAVIGMLTTVGFRDLLDLGRERRYDLFDLRLVFPAPLVPPTHRREIAERVRHDGTVARPLDPSEVDAAVQSLVETQGVEAVAVCFLHAYLDPAHEEVARALIARRYPALAVSTSADVLPFMGEYDRFTTTTINAYVQPMMGRYLERLERGLAAHGFAGTVYIMTSAGGTMTVETSRRFPVRLLESGPVAGALMSATHGRVLGLPDLLSFDMGGTTAKGCLIRGGVPRKKYEHEVARVHEFKPGSGLPVKAPFIDMIEIGAGGGSVAEVDERGLMRVGPRSAGADPGPACYGRGGRRPTLTDANLVLGYLDPQFFLGGKMALDRDAAARAIEDGVGRALGLSVIQAAWGIHEIVNEDVARAFRVHAAERGVDYRGCSMVAFGGSGPLHALRVARKLRIPRVVLPLGAGVMSAVGLLVSPLSFDVVRSRRVALEDLTPARLEDGFRPLVADAMAPLRAAGVAPEDIAIARRLDMRYRGQGFEIEVPLPSSEDWTATLGGLPALFARTYGEVFSVATVDQPLEIVNWKVEAMGPRPALSDRYQLEAERASSSRAAKGARPAYFPEAGGEVECAVYDRYALRPGQTVVGPALIEERESTCVIGPGERAHVDARLHLIAELAREGASS